jgi:signal transduction histidine kinase
MINLKTLAAKIKKIVRAITEILKPRNKNEDTARREYILNILIFFSIICFLILNIIRVLDFIAHGPDRGLPIAFTLIILGFFSFLFWLSKKSLIKSAAWLLIIIYSIPMLYSFLTWGADLPAALLMAVLIITFFGILMGSRAAVISALVINLALIILTYLQANGFMSPHAYWRQKSHEPGDAITYALLMMIITIIVWIFDRSLNKALTRAHLSEQALKQERDDLEIKVEERTNKIREMETEKIGQLYRLAEFGRLSSGVFHDLINPLTAVSLNLEQIKNENEANLIDAKDCLSQAISASHKMEDLIICIKKSIRQENIKINFLPKTEIEVAMNILGYKSRKANTEVHFFCEDEAAFYGNPVKFSQIIINLISNSIDSCEAKKENFTQIVNINLKRQTEFIIIEVKDCGVGIPPENINKVFQPFFSTKEEGGLGLGLSSTKNIIEKEFSGSIVVSSEINKETIFTVTLPLTYAT